MTTLQPYYQCVLFAVYLVFTICAILVSSQSSEFQSHKNWKLLDLGEDCGQSASNRIIGGREAFLGQYPWIARLGYNDGFQRHVCAEVPSSRGIEYKCGGSIISDRYILTAAHCVNRKPLRSVRLGEHDIRTHIDCMDGVCAPAVQDIDVEKITCHNKYTRWHYKNDICLLRLAAPIKFNRYVQPICLPMYDYFQLNNFTGTMMEVAGWGLTDLYIDKGSDVLLTLNVPVITQSLCASKAYKKKNITDSQLCAGGVAGRDSCRGDSGGPLMNAVSLEAPPRYFVVGVLSFGYDCAIGNFPGVYTKVSYFMKWILDNVTE